MSRMMIESLEARELMAGDASFAGDGLVLPGVRAGIVMEFTPPIGSDKGSVVGSQVTDGTSNTMMFRTASFSGDAYVNEMGVIGTTRPQANGIIAILIGLVQSPQSGGGDMSSLRVAGTEGPQANGIIAILIGLHQSPQPSEAETSSLTVGTQSTKGSYYLLPYIEQENVYKVAGGDVVLDGSLMEEEGIYYF